MVTEQDIIKAQMRQERDKIKLTEQQIDNDPNAIYADQMREDKASNLLDQINPDNLLTDIEHRIRGEKKDPYTKRWVPISKKYTMEINEELISNFMSFLGAILNQTVSMSNFSANEINNMMELIVSYIKHDLTVNDEKYGIVGNYTEMSRIGIIICTACFSTFKQAMNGTLSRRIFGSLKVSADLTRDNKKSLKDAMKFWS